MPEDEKDVKESESSADEELEEETEESEGETEESENEEDVNEEPESSDGSKEETEEETPEQLKERLKKAEEKAANLQKALQEKRNKERTPVTQPKPDAPKTDSYAEAIVKDNEDEAWKEFYKEHPEYETDNALYNQLVQDMVIATKVRGITPVKKEHFLDLARTAYNARYGAKGTKEAEERGRKDAHKEHLKAEAANLGGTSTSSSRPKNEPVVTEADRRAAAAAGQDIKTYLKYRNAWKNTDETEEED